jgi:hypothetical protein
MRLLFSLSRSRAALGRSTPHLFVIANSKNRTSASSAPISPTREYGSTPRPEEALMALNNSPTGASLLEIADTLGHRTLAMVKRYSHLTQSHKVAAIEKMVKKRGL